MSDTKGLLFPPKVYDRLKPVAQIVLPSLATFYFGLGQVWHFGYVEQVVATITLFNALLGALLGLSSYAYKNSDARFDGTLEVDEQETKTIHQLAIDTPPEQLKDQDQVTFKVRKIPPVRKITPGR